MRRIQQSGLPFYQFDHLARDTGVRHGVFTREGGVSRPPFDSLNVAHGIGDVPAHVQSNRDRIQTAVGGGRTMAWMHQVHGCRIHRVRTASDTGVPSADALITTETGLLLAVQVADCQPVLLYDPRHRAVGCVHSGWRGSIVNILGKTVAEMTRQFGCRPVDILAGIGPSLGPCCAEFRHYRSEIPRNFWSYRNSHNYFDFWAVSTDQLRRAGVLRKNIEVQGICTRCHSDHYFSYRAAKTTGRLAAVIGLAPDGADTRSSQPARPA